MTTKNPVVGLRLSLSTLLLLLTLFAVGTAYYLARDARIDRALAMGRMRLATRQADLDDPELAQISVMDSHPTYASWHLWIPYSGAYELRYAYRGFHSQYANHFEQVAIQRGRHELKLLCDRDSGSIELRLDDEVIATRDGDNDWNVSYPWDITQHQTLGSTPQATIVKAFGKAHLAADEVFVPDKHRFGLHVWLRQLP